MLRRMWPNPVAELEVAEPTGVVTVLSDKIVSFDVQYFFEEQWIEEWPVEMQELGELPALISVSLAMRPDENRAAILTHEFLVNFPRWPGSDGGGAQIGMGGESPAGGTGGEPGTTGPGNPGLSGENQ
ncbi:MAG: hypothetical protein GY869_04755, partial [Planctomycetes bacterium]|nr:hypothetical protein [Planctomycetota bacterium]